MEYSKKRIEITTADIATLLKIETKSVNTAIHRKQINLNSTNPWINFWNLVEYLEEKGLRPINSSSNS